MRILFTTHRREAIDSGMRDVVRCMAKLSIEYPEIEVVWPVHPNPEVRKIAEEEAAKSNIRMIEPQPYSDMVALMLCSQLIVTDSGGIQEEAAWLGIPVLVTRDVTERPELEEEGGSIVVGANGSKLRSTIDWLLTDQELYNLMAKQRLIYGDGHAAEKIVNFLEECI